MTKNKAFAVDVGGHNIRTALVDSHGNILSKRQVPTPESRRFDEVINTVSREIEHLQSESKIELQEICGLGICIPGYLEQPQSVVRFAPNFPQWEGLSFEAELKGRWPFPVYRENDANAHVIGEAWVGAAVGSRDVVLFALGTGVGGGIISEGRLVHGHTGAAGEIGHFYVDGEEALMCGCGTKGCLESVASATAIETLFHQTPLQLSDRAKAGDPQAIAYFNKMGKCLGIAISTTCMVLEPEIIILSGKISYAMDLFETSMRKTISERLVKHSCKNIRVAQAVHVDDAGILGSAKLCFNA